MDQVYIFDFGDKIKVGFSTRVKERLAEIEAASGGTVKQIYVVDAGKIVEQKTHARLRNRLNGEYFAVPFLEAKAILDSVVKEEIENPSAANPCHTITVRLSVEYEALLRDYCNQHEVSISNFIRQTVLERIEDEIDLDLYKRAIAAHHADPVTYSLDEVERMLGVAE